MKKRKGRKDDMRPAHHKKVNKMGIFPTNRIPEGTYLDRISKTYKKAEACIGEWENEQKRDDRQQKQISPKIRTNRHDLMK